MSDLGFVKDILDITKELGVLRRIASALNYQTPKAAEHLGTVVIEMGKIYTFLDGELSRFLGLSLDGSTIQDDREALTELEGGRTSARVAGAKTHCAKIKNIYSTHLDPWLRDVVIEDDLKERFKEVFERLNSSDYEMTRLLDEAALWLQEKSTLVLNLHDGGNLEAARQEILASRREILPIRRDLAKNLFDLRELEAEFVNASGIPSSTVTQPNDP